MERRPTAIVVEQLAPLVERVVPPVLEPIVESIVEPVVRGRSFVGSQRGRQHPVVRPVASGP